MLTFSAVSTIFILFCFYYSKTKAKSAMKKATFIFAFLFCLSGLYGQQLHFILLAPDDATYENVFPENLKQRVEQLAAGAGLELDWQFYDRAVSPDRLRRELNTLPSGPNDLIWFYYYGPAAYDNDNFLEDFPYFELRDEPVYLSQIHLLLRSRPHRLCLTFLDGANNRSGVIGKSPDVGPTLDRNNLEALLNARGDLIVTGYARGQNSGYHPTHGGLFTHAFFQALEYVAGPEFKREPIWAEVLLHTDLFMEQMLSHLEKEQRHFHQLNIEAHDFADGKPPRGMGYAGEESADYYYAIPPFPFPPPPASASTTLPRRYLEGLNTLADFDAKLRQAIDQCRYEKSYYSVPDGFALVTRIEQFDGSEGSSLPPPDRWSAEIKGMEEFSIRNYLKALFFGQEGNFRVFVFLVTSVPFSQSGRDVTKAEVEDWLSTGMNRLPPQLGKRPLKAEHECTVLIYEFLQDESGTATFIESSALTSRTHLEKSQIMGFLEQRP